MTEHSAYIGLGSNMGDRQNNLRQALSELETHPSILSVEVSSFYETKPLGPSNQDDFLNAVVKLRTLIGPFGLWKILNRTEIKLGRRRKLNAKKNWGPRTLDLDLLLYEEGVLNEPDLVIPHPQMHLRSFVLTGMCELAPDFIHPVLGRSMQELATRLNGGNYWLDSEKPQLISIAGNIGVGKTTLAAGLAERLNAKFISEKYDDNPFLPEVYAGRTELALDSELFFLSSSASQLRKDRLFASRHYVSDYVFDKALIYASSWLTESDLGAYREQYEYTNKTIAAPVLVIYLWDNIQNCLERIHKRNRPYEQRIESSFLEHLADGYDRLYTGYESCPIIRLTPEECRRVDQVDRIAKEINYYLAEAIK